jgi:hypothetical protein
MNDYSKGALEALVWAKTLLERSNTDKAMKEINDAIITLHYGIALDFKDKLESSKPF